MVVVSHLFSFYGKISGADLTHASQICPCLELSISRQPLFWLFKGMRVKCTSSSYLEDELLYEGGDSCSINYLTLV